MAYFEDVEEAYHAPEGALRKAGLGPKTIQSLVETRSTIDLDMELARIEESGFKLLTWQDEDYPPRLREIDTPPPVLYVWGELLEQDRYAAAIVGTRRATSYGKAVTERLASALAQEGLTIVSGLARGIDGIAHRAALQAGGRTLAVLGSGLDRVYPPEHRKLATSIAKQGAVLSDYPLGTEPEGKNFPPRNRIISGLSLAVIVVEAGASSGALITADFGLDQSREVFAVPGDLYKSTSEGTNNLIQMGAHPLLSPEDVLEVLNLELAARQEDVAAELPEDESERTVYQALGEEPVHVDELRSKCDMPVEEITASLAMLELKGRARQVGGMHYVRAREERAIYRVE
jgi:DNA processing protein